MVGVRSLLSDETMSGSIMPPARLQQNTLPFPLDARVTAEDNSGGPTSVASQFRLSRPIFGQGTLLHKLQNSPGGLP